MKEPAAAFFNRLTRCGEVNDAKQTGYRLIQKNGIMPFFILVLTIKFYYFSRSLNSLNAFHFALYKSASSASINFAYWECILLIRRSYFIGHQYLSVLPAISDAYAKRLFT